MSVVKLFIAYYWDCPCGHRNFAEGIPVELTDDDRAEIEEREGVDMEGMGAGELVTRPDEVTCQHCNATHECLDDREEPWEPWEEES